jgi:hypothetical protein
LLLVCVWDLSHGLRRGYVFAQWSDWASCLGDLTAREGVYVSLSTGVVMTAALTPDVTTVAVLSREIQTL